MISPETLNPFTRTLYEYVLAQYPAIAVLTHEEERFLKDVRALAPPGARSGTEPDWGYATWSMTQGWTDAQRRELKVPGRQDPVRAVQAIGELPQNTLCIFLDLHPYLRQVPALVRAIRDQIDVAKSSARPMVFCSPTFELPVELEKDVELLDYPLPAVDDYRALLLRLIDEHVKNGAMRVPPDDVITAIARAATGLTWAEAENALALALVRYAATPDRMVEVVRHEKAQAVKKNGVLEIQEPSETLTDVIGLEVLKEQLAHIAAIIRDPPAALRWGLQPGDFPKGVLLCGVPGTGKSLIARAFAASIGRKLMPLRTDQILDKHVGASEAKLRQALRTADALGAEAVLFLDEIDRIFAGSERGDLDSGVMSHQVGQMLSWLQDRALKPDGTPPIPVIATTNHPERLPAPLVRRGRWDGVFYFDLPTRAELNAALLLHLGKRGQKLDEAFAAGVVAEFEQRQFTPAEVEDVVVSACKRALVAGRATIATEDVRAALEKKTLAETRPEDIRAIREWGQQHAQNANRVPESAGSGRKVTINNALCN